MKTLAQIVIAAGVVAGMAAAQAFAPASASQKTPPASTSAIKPVPTNPQSVPAKSTAAPAKAAVPVAKPVPKPVVAAKPVAKTTTVAAKPVLSAKPKTARVAKVVKPKAAEAKGDKETSTASKTHRRDPFVNPIKQQEADAQSQPSCTTGARCLVVSQVILKGVVKTTKGMIAMVENSSQKQYNLHEKDPVLNGFVLKITTDAITFRETVTDLLGRSSTREVVKRVTVPPV